MNLETLGKVTKEEENRMFVEVPAKDIQKTMAKLRLSGFCHITTITGDDTGSAINVFYHISKETFTLTIKTEIGRSRPQIDTIVGYFPGAALYERELAEMLGVRVNGNLTPKNIFLDESSPKAPLRKRRASSKPQPILTKQF